MISTEESLVSIIWAGLMNSIFGIFIFFQCCIVATYVLDHLIHHFNCLFVIL
jgi:hypothetical protein